MISVFCVKEGSAPNKSFLIAFNIFRPLQGFFNAIIFIYQKAYSLRQANRQRRLRLCGAIWEVVTSPSIVPTLLISGMEIPDADRHQAEFSNSIVRRGRERDALIETQVRAQLVNTSEDTGAIMKDIDDASLAALSDLEDISSAVSFDEIDLSSLAVEVPEDSNGNLVLPPGLESIAYSNMNRLASVVEEDEDEDDDCENDDALDDEQAGFELDAHAVLHNVKDGDSSS
eukprot:CAMPEP_0204618488 /NCGR_PEP_ID=MMETSP0717-20131115/5115_1 /ASSEMBLY_ACC=CAM_ASM_000666 /TAXON_ID=230516 /ORGANISM="Chaetoceros curvisetus" /LENGTH=228 /DNA_ID=CAMNT_0051632231 /DNA_START=527 /DNA_END=1213 /DNA_ORIENTATION=+